VAKCLAATSYLLVSRTECRGRPTARLNNEYVKRRDASAYVELISFTLQFLRHKLWSVDEHFTIVVDGSE